MQNTVQCGKRGGFKFTLLVSPATNLSITGNDVVIVQDSYQKKVVKKHQRGIKPATWHDCPPARGNQKEAIQGLPSIWQMPQQKTTVHCVVTDVVTFMKNVNEVKQALSTSVISL